MRTYLKRELIMRGTKLILVSVGNKKFLYFHNYITAFSALSKGFRLAEIEKGYFPPLFTDNMKPALRETIFTLRSSRLLEVFDF